MHKRNEHALKLTKLREQKLEPHRTRQKRRTKIMPLFTTNDETQTPTIIFEYAGLKLKKITKQNPTQEKTLYSNISRRESDNQKRTQEQEYDRPNRICTPIEDIKARKKCMDCGRVDHLFK